MRKIVVLLFIIAVAFDGYSQDFRKNRKEAERIKASTEYYWGQSTGCRNQPKAEDKALENLLENIAEDNTLHTLYFADSDSEENEQKVRAISTFTDELPKNTMLVLNNGDGEASVFRYVSKKDFSNICERREKKINSYIADGRIAEQDVRYGNALRYYYWAMMLCYSHPNGEDLMFKYDNINSVNTSRWLQRKIEELLESIKIQPRQQEKAEKSDFVLSFTNGDDRINGLDFSYNNGNGTAKGSVENGLSYIKLVDSDMSEVLLYIELENKTIVKSFDSDVYAIMNKLDDILYFPDVKKTVNIEKAKRFKNLDDVKSQLGSVYETAIVGSERFIAEVSSPHEEYLKIMANIEKVMSKKDGVKAENIEKFFTPEGMEMLESLLDYGKIRMIGKPSYKFIDYRDEVICRSIPMQFNFRNNVAFLREIVFRFDKKTQKVKSLAFRLNDITESQILSKEHWSDDARLTLISFVEDYQTAYALKRKNYLESVFSDEALIVVGSVLKERKKSDNVLMKEEVKIKYDTLSKGQYLGRLENVFDNNEFVNLNFSNTQFNTVNGKNNVIGVQLRQEYFSSSYSDVGYLFLMVDLRDELPVIHVRTWQPNETPVDEIIDNTSFILR